MLFCLQHKKKILLRKLGIVGASTALLLGCGNDMPSFAIESSQASTMTTPSRDIYFGVGCFWHVQHEFVQTEQNLLGRSKDMVTSAAGYAGGTRLGSNQQQKGATAMGSKTVCYHNLLGIADYGKLGHGEVVGMDIPNDAIGAFAKKYFSLFKKGDRPDLGDLGSEYRALIGIPGGVTSPFFPAIEKEAEIIGVSLVKGNGNDADTLRTKTIWVMDSNQFPFHQAEIYHQFHDGFMPGEQYPATYNSLAKNAFRDGRIVPTGCPDV